MKKEDLKVGNVIELRGGDKFIVIVKFDDVEFDLVSVKGNLLEKLSGFNENLEDFGNHNFDIMKVYEDYTLTNLLWKRKEIIVSESEKWLLRNLPDTHKYIARNKYTGLYVYRDKPKKREINWNRLDDDSIPLCGFNHLFQFIKWEDEEPYLISDLLEEDK